MSDKKRRRRDFRQNLVIALLAVSAVFLFMQTQIYNLGIDGYLRTLSQGPGQTGTVAREETTGLSAPVRIAVADSYGRYADVAMTTADETFDPLRKILGEVLGSARTYNACSSRAYLEALSGTSIYYDFLNPLPLDFLAELAGIETDETATARSIAVAPGTDGVDLYIWNGGDEYRRYDTAVSKEALNAVIVQYEMGDAQFAFERSGKRTESSGIFPYALFPETVPKLPVLSETVPAFAEDALLEILQFNPNTKSRYTESGGTEVIMENGRALRLHKNGSLAYQSGGEETLFVKAEGETPSLREVIAGSGQLMAQLARLNGGNGSLYLTGVQQNGQTVTLTYGYQVQGVPVCFSDRAHAGEVVLTDAVISSLTLRLRQYAVQEGTDSMLLPLRQALAIAERYEETELYIGYTGDGSGRATAQWLVE